MASSIDICNSALNKLGVNTINDFTDNTKRAQVCDLQYDIIRKKLLRKYHWSWAIKRAALTLDAGTPTFGWDYQYELPSDFVRLLHDEEYEDKDYLIEGGYLLANEDTFNIKYVYDVTDTDEFDDLFVEVFALTLAVELCMILVQSTDLKNNLAQELKETLADARTINSQERKRSDEDALDADEFLDARL